MFATAEPAEYVDASHLEGSPDGDLIRMVKAGSDVALGVLLRRHRDALYRFCLHLTNNREDAEDVCQESMARAITRVDSLQAGSAFRSWLFSIARNLSIDSHRSRKRTCALPDEELVPLPLPLHQESPYDRVEAREEYQTVAEALSKLKKNHQTVLLLREVEGMSYAEIGQRLDLSQAAVETLLFRARKRLREEYTKTGAPVPAVALLGALRGLLSRLAAPFGGLPLAAKLAGSALLIGGAAIATPRVIPALHLAGGGSHPAAVVAVSPSGRSSASSPAMTRHTTPRQSGGTQVNGTSGRATPHGRHNGRALGLAGSRGDHRAGGTSPTRFHRVSGRLPGNGHAGAAGSSGSVAASGGASSAGSSAGGKSATHGGHAPSSGAAPNSRSSQSSAKGSTSAPGAHAGHASTPSAPPVLAAPGSTSSGSGHTGTGPPSGNGGAPSGSSSSGTAGTAAGAAAGAQATATSTVNSAQGTVSSTAGGASQTVNSTASGAPQTASTAVATGQHAVSGAAGGAQQTASGAAGAAQQAASGAAGAAQQTASGTATGAQQTAGSTASKGSGAAGKAAGQAPAPTTPKAPVKGVPAVPTPVLPKVPKP